MMKKFYVIASLLLAGCASSLKAQSQSVLERYKMVAFEDGVSLDEAKLIAQRELVRAGEVAVYDLANPRIATKVADLPRSQDHWFVFFDEREAGSLKYIFMVVVNQKTGDIKFSQGYAEDKRWILEAALLR